MTARRVVAWSFGALLSGACGDNLVPCSLDRPDTSACLAAVNFACRNSADLVPTQSEVDLYFLTLTRAAELEPLFARIQTYRFYGTDALDYDLRVTDPALWPGWAMGDFATGDAPFDQALSLLAPAIEGSGADGAFTLRFGRYFSESIFAERAASAYRYHATRITTPRQARHALAYVLNNWRRHREDHAAGAALDPFASGRAFDGWARSLRGASLEPALTPLPVTPPRCWLLTSGWRRHGLVAPGETPGP